MSYFVRTFFISCPISLKFFLVNPNIRWMDGLYFMKLFSLSARKFILY